MNTTNTTFGKIPYLFWGFFMLLGIQLYGQDTPPYDTQPVAGANGLYLFSYDEPLKMSRPEAICACQNKGAGWRLPTVSELQQISAQNAGLTAGYTYWTIDKVYGKLKFYTVSADNGKVKKSSYNAKNSIRCVWSSTSIIPTAQPVGYIADPAPKAKEDE